MSIDRSRIVDEYFEFPTDSHGDTDPIDFAEHIATLSRNEALEEAAQYVDRKCTPTGDGIRALYTSAPEQSKPQSNAI